MKCHKLFHNTLKSCALNFECVNGVLNCFRPEVNFVKLHKGQRYVAEFMYKLLSGKDGAGSKLNLSLKPLTNNYLQDAYSIRCMPQVMGPIIESIEEKMQRIIDLISKGLTSFHFKKLHGELVKVTYINHDNNEEML